MDRKRAKLRAAAQTARLAEAARAQAGDDPELPQERTEVEGLAEIGPAEVPAWPEGGSEETGTEGATRQTRPAAVE